MAVMAPSIHRPDRGLGKALAEAGYSEARLERLLASEGDTRRSLLIRAARFLASKSASWRYLLTCFHALATFGIGFTCEMIREFCAFLSALPPKRAAHPQPPSIELREALHASSSQAL